jgi:ubiquinone/menaquinone biosynthesis C-methylase UbiE
MDHHHRDVGRFDKWAPTYERHWMQRRIVEPVQDTALLLAVAEMPRPITVLDIGCGTGRLLRAAAQRFPKARLEGVDAAAGMVSQAKALRPPGSSIHFQQATAEDLPFPDDEFDLVFSTLTFHHWSDQEKGIGEVSRVLAPGGRWLLADLIPVRLMALVVRLLRIGHAVPRPRLNAMLAGGQLAVVAERRVPRTAGNIPVLAIGARSRSAGIAAFQLER